MSTTRPKPPDDTKVCASCGRQMTWRPAWERSWESVKYCSDACRKHRYETKDEALEKVILDLLGRRARGATICPSEASRAFFGVEQGLLAAAMERTRCAARRLVERGAIKIFQKGKVADPSTVKGPIRLKAT